MELKTICNYIISKTIKWECYLKHIYYKRYSKEKLATAYHEAGHCSVALLFADRLILHTISINKDYLEKIDPTYNGGLRIEWDVLPNQSDYEAGDNLILISLAGICSATLFSRGLKYVKVNYLDFKYGNNSKSMEMDGAVQDYRIVQDYRKLISQRLQIDSKTIEWSAFRWVYEYLMTPEIWSATRCIAVKLIEHSNQTLTEQEIKDISLTTGLRSFFDSNRNSLLAKRYPMTKGTLRT